jgi:hypothetical protein
MLVLPTRTDTARYSFETELDGKTFTFEFEWNDRDLGWYMTILDASGVTLLAGRRVVIRAPLTGRYRDSRLPPGHLEAIDTSGADAEAGYGDLGDRVKLCYTPAG